jgi:hypothetical protein
MSTSELQNSIIQKVLHTNDTQLLDYLNHLLSNDEQGETYILSDFERSILNESMSDYKLGKTITGDDVFKRNEKWLKE